MQAWCSQYEITTNGRLICMGAPLFLFRLSPSEPCDFQVIGGVVCRTGSNWLNSLTIRSANEVDQKTVEQVTHVVLLLACS